jgi:signal transduction histidine kinase
MGVQNCSEPTLSNLLARRSPAGATPLASAEAERQWHLAIAAAQSLLLEQGQKSVVLAGPLPVFSLPQVLALTDTWLWLPPAWYQQWQQGQAQSLPVRVGAPCPQLHLVQQSHERQSEHFCLLLTPRWSLLLILEAAEQGQEQRRFQVTFDPTAIEPVMQQLAREVYQSSREAFAQLQTQLAVLPVQGPDIALISRFTQLLLSQSSSASAELTSAEQSPAPVEPSAQGDLELLQAIAHEVKTPLATIRTLVRSLLRRADLPDPVRQRLDSIDNECTEQIDRFGLIFRAAELAHQPSRDCALARTSLSQMLYASLPRWQRLAARRGVSLSVHWPASLPAVVSDPQMLDQALIGLFDRLSRGLPQDSSIEVEVSLAGEQLKLQLRAKRSDGTSVSQPGRALGSVLMVQPETGSLSLTHQAAKNLFQTLGGHLRVQQQPACSEVLTVFLPLESDPTDATASPPSC